MNRARRLLTRVFGGIGWRELATAPLDREIELAVIDDRIGVLDASYRRDRNGWLDAKTLTPVTVTATHWRYPRLAMLPMGCC